MLQKVIKTTKRSATNFTVHLLNIIHVDFDTWYNLLLSFSMRIYRNLLVCLSFLITSTSHAQNPLTKKWDKRYGGANNEWLTIIQNTLDKGYILGGFTNSNISGDVTQSSRTYWDWWIVKTDEFGNKKWDKRFGGDADDWLYSLQETSDRGFILGGITNSDSSGDVSYNSHGTDFWIVKTDSVGNKEWDKRFWGNIVDELFSLQQTTDGGYILGGWTTSDSGGHISEPTRGGWDFWIIKTDLWQQNVG